MSAIATRFWVPMMWRARVINVVATYAGSAHNLLDYSPDSNCIYYPNAYRLLTLFDLDTLDNNNIAPNSVMFFIRNGASFTTAKDLKVSVSPGDGSWLEIVGSGGYNKISAANSYPLVLWDIGTLLPYRYWAIELSKPGESIEGGMIWVGRFYNLTARWNWGSPTDQGYYNQFAASRDGRILVEGGGNGAAVYQRHYEGLNDNQIAAIQGAWDTTMGGRYPMVITDDIPASGWYNSGGTANARTSRLVRFRHPPDGEGNVKLGAVEVQCGLWNVILYLQELPWTGEGLLT